MKKKLLIIEWLSIVVIVFVCCGLFVAKIDPYFHFHKPLLNEYLYTLDNQRSQNDGILKNFEYDAVITGTSMTENFKTSEFDEIFGVNSIKVCFSGGSYKEMNDNLKVAFSKNPNLKAVVRCLDIWKFIEDKDYMRDDLGSYPTYLYDNNPLNDVEYLLNRDVIFERAYVMETNRKIADYPSGMTTFDAYSSWSSDTIYGIDVVATGRTLSSERGESIPLTEEEKDIIRGNITQNVTDLADEYPETEFYYFFDPACAAWWANALNEGTLEKQIEAEKLVIELILEHPNIHLYSFSTNTDITMDLNNYMDGTHYGGWINSLILKWMHEGEGLLTKENYEAYLEKEYDIYSNCDYEALNTQENYSAEMLPGALWNEVLTGETPVNLLQDEAADISLNGAELVDGLNGDKPGIRSAGFLQTDQLDGLDIYLRDTEYIGVEITVPSIGAHRYLSFYGRKEADCGQPTVYIYDSEGTAVKSFAKYHGDIDNEWHQYVIELPRMNGEVTMILNGGFLNYPGAENSVYDFSEITLY